MTQSEIADDTLSPLAEWPLTVFPFPHHYLIRLALPTTNADYILRLDEWDIAY